MDGKTGNDRGSAEVPFPKLQRPASRLLRQRLGQGNVPGRQRQLEASPTGLPGAQSKMRQATSPGLRISLADGRRMGSRRQVRQRQNVSLGRFLAPGPHGRLGAAQSARGGNRFIRRRQTGRESRHNGLQRRLAFDLPRGPERHERMGSLWHGGKRAGVVRRLVQPAAAASIAERLFSLGSSSATVRNRSARLRYGAVRDDGLLFLGGSPQRRTQLFGIAPGDRKAGCSFRSSPRLRPRYCSAVARASSV